jgi:hypothetical protein
MMAHLKSWFDPFFVEAFERYNNNVRVNGQWQGEKIKPIKSWSPITYLKWHKVHKLTVDRINEMRFWLKFERPYGAEAKRAERMIHREWEKLSSDLAAAEVELSKQQRWVLEQIGRDLYDLPQLMCNAKKQSIEDRQWLGNVLTQPEKIVRITEKRIFGLDELDRLKKILKNFYPKYFKEYIRPIENRVKWNVGWWNEVQELKKILKNVKESRPDVFYSLDNSPEVNDEIYRRDGQVISQEREKVMKGILADGVYSGRFAQTWHILNDNLQILSNHWDAARRAKTDHLQLKECLTNPAQIAELSYFQMKPPLTSENLRELKSLEKSYFNNSRIEQCLKGIHNIVVENEKMYGQVSEKWMLINRQEPLFLKGEQGLDRREYGNKPREKLSDILSKARQNKDKGDINKRSTKTVGAKVQTGIWFR